MARIRKSKKSKKSKVETNSTPDPVNAVVKTPPRFVNLQATPVSVYDENKRRVEVPSWSMRERIGEAECIVEGEWYAQFVSTKGPLFPIPSKGSSVTPPPPVRKAPAPADPPPSADDADDEGTPDAEVGDSDNADE